MRAEPKFSLRECLLEDCDPVELASHRFDTVFCVNVLEHIEDDVAALATFKRVVQPGGHVLVWVPAVPAAYGPLDAELGHHRRYTKRVAGTGVHARRAGDRVAALHQPDRPDRLDVQRARRQVHDPQPAADQAVRNAGRAVGAPARPADSSPAGPVPGCRRPTHALDGRARRRPRQPRRWPAGSDSGARLASWWAWPSALASSVRRRASPRACPTRPHAGRVGGRRRHLALRRAVGGRAFGRHAAHRWLVCLPARGLGTAPGVPVRLGAADPAARRGHRRDRRRVRRILPAGPSAWTAWPIRWRPGSSASRPSWWPRP